MVGAGGTLPLHAPDLDDDADFTLIMDVAAGAVDVEGIATHLRVAPRCSGGRPLGRRPLGPSRARRAVGRVDEHPDSGGAPGIEFGDGGRNPAGVVRRFLGW